MPCKDPLTLRGHPLNTLVHDPNPPMQNAEIRFLFNGWFDSRRTIGIFCFFDPAEFINDMDVLKKNMEFKCNG